MSDQPFIMPDTNPTPTRRHVAFPAVAQFLILVVIIGGLLGSVVFPYFLTPKEPYTTLELSAAVTTGTDTIPVTSIVPPQNLRATAVHVYDINTDTTLYSKAADETLPLASITKLMTALVAEELVAEDTTYTVSNAALAQLGESGLLPNEALTSKALRDYSLIASSNDAAYALADAIGNELLDNGNHQAFVEAMNIRADELELSSLEFKNATGLDISATTAGAIGNASDVSRLMGYIVKNYQYILEPTTTAADRVYNEAGAFHEAENTNPVIYRIPNLLGSKTGYTDLAGGNLTIAFDAGYNRPIVITVLGSGFEERFTDVLALVESVQAAFNEQN